MAREKANYKIEATTYTKRPTGEKDRYGNPIYEVVGEPTRRIVKGVNNFSELKKDVYEKSKGKNNVYVDYSDPVYRINKVRPRLNSVTTRKSDGSKTVTYYKAVKK